LRYESGIDAQSNNLKQRCLDAMQMISKVICMDQSSDGGVLQKDNFIYEGVLHWGEYNAITCAVVFGVCFGLVPFSQCMGYWIYSAKKKILRKYTLSGKSSTTSSNENLKSRDKIHYSGFDQSDQNCATIVKPPQGKAVADLQKEQKRTRRRTNSGLYDKLENLPPSDM
jgi:hypothetical protein